MDILQTKKCLHRVTTSQLLTKRTKKTHTHTRIRVHTNIHAHN